MSADQYPKSPGSKGGHGPRKMLPPTWPRNVGGSKLVLAAVTEAGPVGLTADEVAARLELDRWSVQPRTSELRRLGLIGDSRQRRRNVTGKRAVVWVAACHVPEREAQDEAA